MIATPNMQTLGYNQNSLFAYRILEPKLNDRQREVYDAMRMMNRKFTDNDLADFLGWKINCITNRRGELLKKRLIRKSGDVIQNGRKASLWECGIIS